MSSMKLLNETPTNPACNPVHLKVQLVNDTALHHFYIHPGMLTACKNKLLPGGTGELVRRAPYSLTYTRLAPQNYILTLEHASVGTVHSERVHGHEASVLHSNPDFIVSGFEDLTDACFLREFYIPSVRFPKTNIAPFADKQAVQKRLKSMAIAVHAHTDSLTPAVHTMLRTGTLLKAKLATKPPSMQHSDTHPKKTERRSLLSMQTAKRMLYFNRNATSRIRSLFCRKPLNFARNLCLSVALAHNGKHAQEGMLLMHTMQYAPLSEANKQSLEELKLQKPACTICYLAQDSAASGEPRRHKVRLYQLPPSTLHGLRQDDLVSRTPTAYVAFTHESSKPLFIGNVDSVQLEAALHPESARRPHDTAWQTDSSLGTRRLWLHAAATEHKALAQALPHIMPSLTDDTDLFASHTAFELWHLSTPA
jgi:hypothetical protein